MKKTLLLGIAAATWAHAYSVTPADPPDTTASRQLDEVVIEAPRVIHKPDMDLYYPSRTAVENSKNGMQLLGNLMIPSLAVTDALGTIQAAGRPVQVRINGREATIDQVRALLPQTVKRVEWIENPGLRYKGADYVLNFIVVNPTLGGSLQASARPALNQRWGVYMGNAKFNSGRSQFEVGANYKLTTGIRSHRDFTETFTYPDGKSVTRRERPLGGSMDNSAGYFWGSYNYIKPDTTVIVAEVGVSRKFNDRFRFDGLMSFDNGTPDILLTDTHGDPATRPGISLYWEQHLGRQHTLVVDVATTFHAGKVYSDYVERLAANNSIINDIHTLIRDRNSSCALQANYIRNWASSRLTAGVSYSANRNRSVYENLGGEVFHQRQDMVYFFAEYFRSIRKFTFSAGMGAQYTDFMFRESGRGNHSWNIRPQASLSYAINQAHRLQLNFESWQSAPTLAETNATPQQSDGFQWRIGNPSLKTSTSYMLTIRYNFSLPRTAATFGIRAFTSPDAITPWLYWDESRLITTYENSRGLQNLSFFLAPQVELIPKWLMLSGYVQYRAEKMRGTGYKLHSHNWSGHVNLQLMHSGFVLSAQYIRSQRDLWGEKISWGEDVTVIDLSYNWKNWQFGAGILMPFGRYDQGSEMLSKWNRNEQHLRLDMRMPFLHVSYNLQWGRQRHGARKLVSAGANVESSKAGGR